MVVSGRDTQYTMFFYYQKLNHKLTGSKNISPASHLPHTKVVGKIIYNFHFHISGHVSMHL